MVLVSAQLKPSACFEFEADICVLYHNKSICCGFQTVVHVGNVRQTAIITKMSKVLVYAAASAHCFAVGLSRPADMMHFNALYSCA